jgi:hypothetical protein
MTGAKNPTVPTVPTVPTGPGAIEGRPLRSLVGALLRTLGRG